MADFANGDGRALSALLFTTGALYTLDVFSTLHSSPYTAEVRGGSEENADRVRHWVNVGVAVGLAFGVVESLIAGKPWPLVGSLIVVGAMWWAYDHALKRATSDQEQQAG